MKSTSCEMLGWMKHKLNQDCQEKYQQTQICRWYHYNGRQLRGTKEPLDEAERGEWKAGLKLNTQKMKIMASSPITSWQIDGAEVESVTIWGSKITADGDWSHEIQRFLPLGKKVMTNLDNVLKSKDITLLTKFHMVKAMVFPVVMYRCKRWTIKQAECWRIDAFELWYWRTLESSLDSQEIKLVNPKGNKLWIFVGRTDAEDPILWPTDAKSQFSGKDPDAGEDWGKEEKGKVEGRRRGWQRMRWLDDITSQWTWVWSDWKMVKDREN